nr:phosphotransferase [Pseudoalteromonas sp. A25]
MRSHFGEEDISYNAITSDASFRRYYRVVVEGRATILMDSDPSKLDNRPFIELNRCFAEQGLRVPSILKFDTSQGLGLLEDLGGEHLADRLHLDSRCQDYKEVLTLLPQVAKIPVSPFMKPYDADFIAMEMDIFWQWLVCNWLDVKEECLPSEQWQTTKSLLCEVMICQPQVTMHRDFHSRNIMRVDGQWALIDYQDAVQGPVTYDAVSLLRDCYFHLPSEEFDALRLHSFNVLTEAQQLPKMSYDTYCYYFDLTGLQRHLKAAGIFCRLLLRDNKTGYLQNIMPTLHYIEDVANCYEPFQWLATWLRHDIMPKVEAKLSCSTL